ncbi:hypothetical protein BTZ20_0305 [Rhodococcus sp. MTM3W5.2]|nr:hypothetical protein BTZ20_0305 [Rhodococcus sp. MTM3W5.2]
MAGTEGVEVDALGVRSALVVGRGAVPRGLWWATRLPAHPVSAH